MHGASAAGIGAIRQMKSGFSFAEATSGVVKQGEKILKCEGI